MEVRKKKGFKQTEVGLIPEDWEVKRFDEFGRFFKGKGIKKDEVILDGNPCVRYGELYTRYDSLIKETHSFISDSVARESIKLKSGDLLFAGSGETREEIGKSAVILREDTFAGGDIVVFRPKDVDSVFLGFMSNSAPVSKQKALNGQGDAVVHIYSGGISKIKIPLPPTLAEQAAIATALSDVDDLIANLDQLITKKKDMKQGAMQQLLTGKTRVKGFEGSGAFKQTEVGLIPVEWEVIPLSDAVDFLDGQRRPIKSNERISGEYPYYGASGIIDYVNDYIFDDELILLGEDGENIISRNLPLAFIIKGKAWVNNHAHVMKPKFNFNIKFLNEYLESLDYLLLNSGTAQPKLNKQSCLSLKVIKPTLAEQKAIAQTLSDMDAEINQLETKKAKYQGIKQGMMQELLTGKTRLV